MGSLFDVRRTPPTQIELGRARAAAVVLHWMPFCVAVAGFVTMLWQIAFAVEPSEILYYSGAALMALPLFVKPKLLSVPSDYLAVPQAKCARLYRHCEATPEGRRYHRLVLEQGRQFVCGEFAMMEQWSRSIADRAACKALYGGPIEQSAEPEQHR